MTERRTRQGLAALATALVVALTSCARTGTAPALEPTSSPPSPSTTVDTGKGCADVVDVAVTPGSSGYRFDVTISSADTGWDKYADRWDVVGPDGTIYGTRVLAHPHVDEQPFTRSQSGITVPAGVDTVEVVAHDSVAGSCGATKLVRLPDR